MVSPNSGNRGVTDSMSALIEPITLIRGAMMLSLHLCFKKVEIVFPGRSKGLLFKHPHSIQGEKFLNNIVSTVMFP